MICNPPTKFSTLSTQKASLQLLYFAMLHSDIQYLADQAIAFEISILREELHSVTQTRAEKTFS